MLARPFSLGLDDVAVADDGERSAWNVQTLELRLDVIVHLIRFRRNQNAETRD
jgi:hypothetical protein